MSRRSAALTAATLVAIGAPIAALLPTASASSALGRNDTTAAYGHFGFTTRGLGQTSSYGEPSLAFAPDGRHIVASTPGGGGVQYWYSADRGRTWSHSSTTSPNGGGDSELDFLPNGTLLSADLEVTDSYIHISHNYGRTWSAVGPAGIEMDRQWLAHSPDGKNEYLVYHDFAAEAEYYAKSTDGGRTWSKSQAANPVTAPDQATAPGIALTPKTGDPASLLDQGVNTYSGPMLVDRNGKDMYVVYSISDLQSNLNPTEGVPPFGPTRGVLVAHSGDAGATWTTRYAVTTHEDPTGASESANGAIFPWGTIGRDGTVYIVFNSTRGATGDHYHQYYEYSTDKGAHWSAPVKLDKLGLQKGASVYTTAAAGAKGVLDVAWYQSDNGTPSSSTALWRPHFAQIVNANTAHPSVTEQALTSVPNHKGGICLQGILCGYAPGSGDRSLADFFELAINPHTGMAGIAYADNYRLGNGKGGGEVVFATQTVGRSAL